LVQASRGCDARSTATDHHGLKVTFSHVRFLWSTAGIHIVLVSALETRRAACRPFSVACPRD
jgi:hypothetical protein